MRIDRVHISDFKRIKLVEFKPEGDLIVVGGKNGQGKTSVLDAIASALGGTKPKIADPVRHGADRYETRIITDTGLEIRQYGTAEGTYGLRVRAADGMEAAQPARFLEKFYSTLTFDPLAFARQSAGEQGETLRRLLGLDWGALDAKRREYYDARANANRQVAEMGAVEEPDPSLPELPLSLNDLADAVNGANELVQQRRDLGRKVEVLANEVSELTQRLDQVKQMLAAAQRAHSDVQARLTELPEPPDVDGLKLTISRAEETNKRILANNEHRRRLAIVEEQKQRSAEMTAKIQGVDAQKRQMIAEAEFPVTGLDFDEEGRVLYNGVLFEQAAESEKIRVSAAVGLEMAPQLKVLLIRDGSLLDEDSMLELQTLAEVYDAQILIERVGAEGAQIVLRDGEIDHGDLPWEE